MAKKVFAILLLSLGLSACESNGNENDANANKPIPSATATVTPAPAASPSAEAGASSAQLKAGDKIKVNISGSTREATVVSVDEKVGKVTVKFTADGKELTVPTTDVVRQ